MPDPLFTSGEACLAPTVFGEWMLSNVLQHTRDLIDLHKKSQGKSFFCPVMN